jgi:hypothetical protein
MGILDRVLELDSDAATRRRMETKCDESFSAACGDRRGAQRLFCKQWLELDFQIEAIFGTHDLQ